MNLLPSVATVADVAALKLSGDDDQFSTEQHLKDALVRAQAFVLLCFLALPLDKLNLILTFSTLTFRRPGLVDPVPLSLP